MAIMLPLVDKAIVLLALNLKRRTPWQAVSILLLGLKIIEAPHRLLLLCLRNELVRRMWLGVRLDTRWYYALSGIVVLRPLVIVNGLTLYSLGSRTRLVLTLVITRCIWRCWAVVSLLLERPSRIVVMCATGLGHRLAWEGWVPR